MENIPVLLLILVIATLVLFLGIRKRKMPSGTGEIDLSLKWQELNKEIIAVNKMVAAHCPDNDEAHQHVINAAMCLVFPNNYGGPYRIIGSGDVLIRYEDGFVEIGKARAIAQAAMADEAE